MAALSLFPLYGLQDRGQNLSNEINGVFFAICESLQFANHFAKIYCDAR